MKILNFDSEGLTSCPMNEVATVAECQDCKCHLDFFVIDYLAKSETNGRFCTFEDWFPDPIGAVEE